MKIAQALRKRKDEQTLSSKSCNFYRQTPETLVYCLLQDKYTDKHQVLDKYLSAKDWEVDNDQASPL